MTAIEANGIEIDFEEFGATTAAPLVLIRGWHDRYREGELHKTE